MRRSGKTVENISAEHSFRAPNYTWLSPYVTTDFVRLVYEVWINERYRFDADAVTGEVVSGGFID